MKHFVVALLLLSLFSCGKESGGTSSETPAQDTAPQPPALTELQASMASYLKDKKAQVGVCVIDLQTGDTLTVNNAYHYPTQSVYKFHLALAVLKKVDEGKLKLDQKIKITREDLHPNTHSPLRDKYPNGNIEMPLSEIIEYSVGLSDNNACDILFKLCPTAETEAFIHSLGIKELSIKATEAEMHSGPEPQFTNWTTPLACGQLLQLFHQGRVLGKETTEFLKGVMLGSPTGMKRLRGGVPEGTAVAHKTGTGGRDDQELLAALNDVGIVYGPEGKSWAIAVFVANAGESNEECEAIIAELSRQAWEWFGEKKK